MMGTMPMKPRKIPIGDRVWELLKEEANVEGVTCAQFIREAALARAIYVRTMRGEHASFEEGTRIIAQLRETQ